MMLKQLLRLKFWLYVTHRVMSKSSVHQLFIRYCYIPLKHLQDIRGARRLFQPNEKTHRQIVNVTSH